MEEISWTDRVRNEDVLLRVKEKYPTYSKKERKTDWICHILCRNCLLRHGIEGMIAGSDRKRRKKT